MNFILEGKLCFTETMSTIMNFILEGKLKVSVSGYVHLLNNYEYQFLEGKFSFTETEWICKTSLPLKSSD